MLERIFYLFHTREIFEQSGDKAQYFRTVDAINLMVDSLDLFRRHVFLNEVFGFRFRKRVEKPSKSTFRQNFCKNEEKYTMAFGQTFLL